MDYKLSNGQKLLNFDQIEQQWSVLVSDSKDKIYDKIFISECRKLLLKIYPPFIHYLKRIEELFNIEKEAFSAQFFIHQKFCPMWDVRVEYELSSENEVVWDFFVSGEIPAAYGYDPLLFYYENRYHLSPDSKFEDLKNIELSNEDPHLIKIEANLFRSDEDILNDIKKVLFEKRREKNLLIKKKPKRSIKNEFIPSHEDIYLIKGYWEGKSNTEIMNMVEKYTAPSDVSSRITVVHNFINGNNPEWPLQKAELGKVRRKTNSDDYKEYFSFKYD